MHTDQNEIIARLTQSFKTLASSAHPDNCLKGFIPAPPKSGRTIVIGAGKASAAMAAAFEEHYPAPCEGLVITRYGHSVPTKHITIKEAAHPVPDEAGARAAKELKELLQTATKDDLIICLLSGGGSALLSSPVEGVTMDALKELNIALLKSGAEISQINTVRKHLNLVLGGKLASFAPDTKMITLAISDVTGDDPATIASGPTVPDPTTLNDARDILTELNITPDAAIETALNNPNNETPKPENKIFNNKEYHLITTPAAAINVAKDFWQDNGFETIIFDTEMKGETNTCAKIHIDKINELQQNGITKPTALLSGGETTVIVKGNGKGGPNTQFMLQSAILLNGNPKVFALACDTDGTDGNTEGAGAFITPDTLTRAKETGLNPKSFLEDNNSNDFFKVLNNLINIGATQTNVNDYRVFLLLP